MAFDDELINGLSKELEATQQKNAGLNMALGNTSYNSNRDANLIIAQIDTSPLLETIEHFLRGDYVAEVNGSRFWVKQTDETKVLFNDYGVNSILGTIGPYLDKNTILSFYSDEMRINEVLADLGDELARFIFCNYEKMGLDTEYKKTRFGLIVINILHIVESSYRRAIRGATSKDINTSQIFTQSDLINRMGNNQQINQQKKGFNLFKPSTW